MVVTWLLLAAASDPGFAVAHVVRGEVVRTHGGATDALSGGALLRANDAVRVGPESWAELVLRGGVRIRLSGSSVVELEGPRSLRLQSGRLWVLRSGPPGPDLFEVDMGSLSAGVPVASSVIFERRRVGGWVMATRAGRAQVGTSSVPAGWMADIKSHGGPSLRIRRGGSALGEIVAQETRRARRDPARLRAFLVKRARAAVLRGLPGAPGGQLIHRSRDEIVRSDRGPAGARLEDSLRPPPFFESEIPPVGPNVRVEVEFE